VEEAHVWAPVILKERDEFLMAYTGLNRHLSQDIGSCIKQGSVSMETLEKQSHLPLQRNEVAAWWEDDICSCRDPHLFRHEGRVWLSYTANTKEGASCIALASSNEF